MKKFHLTGSVTAREFGSWFFFLSVLYWLYQHFVVNGYPIASRRRFQFVFGLKPGYKSDTDRAYTQGVVTAKLGILAFNLQVAYDTQDTLISLEKKYSFMGLPFRVVNEMTDRWVAGRKMRFNTSRRLAESLGFNVLPDHTAYLNTATK